MRQVKNFLSIGSVLCILSIVVAISAQSSVENGVGNGLSKQGYRLIAVEIRSIDDLKVIEQLEDEFNIDVLFAAVGKLGKILAAPEIVEVILARLNQAEISTEVLHDNYNDVVESKRAHQYAKYTKRQLFKRDLDSSIGHDFMHESEIRDWIQNLPSYSGNTCSVASIGRTYENKDIYVVKIGATGNTNKRVVIVEANIHAREWLANAATIYVIQQFLAQSSERIRAAIDKYEWHFIPLANPDGYDFSWTKNRLWRKTRSKWFDDLEEDCFGVDPNRNFDSHFCEAGTSTDACWISYCGPAPFSEKESQALRNYSLALKTRLVSYFSVHTYGQLLLLPFGFEGNGPHTADYDELMRVGKLMAAGITSSTGANYTVGNVADILYAASGTSLDWSKEKLGAKYTYSIELRPTDLTSDDGFVAPSSLIEPTGKDLLEATLVLSEQMRD